MLRSFHLLTWTSVCVEKLLEKNKSCLTLLTMLLLVCVDLVPSKKAWAECLGIKDTRLLADFWLYGKVAEVYDIFKEKDGILGRMNIIVYEK